MVKGSSICCYILFRLYYIARILSNKQFIMERKVVLVTGGAKRIGKSISLHMASCGWNVVVHYNNSKNEAEETYDEITKLGVDCFLVQADLSGEKQLENIFTEYNGKFGKISCLINNASIINNDHIDDISSYNMQVHNNVNLYAPILLSKAFVQNLGGDKGNIINMIDYCVWNLPDTFLSYTLSKFGLWGATQILAKKLAPSVRVNAIGPGHSLRNDKETIEGFQRAKKSTPLQTCADVDEICTAIDFILSSSSMTGQMLALDGGKHLVGADFY